jgi:hypothetical protein
MVVVWANRLGPRVVPWNALLLKIENATAWHIVARVLNRRPCHHIVVVTRWTLGSNRNLDFHERELLLMLMFLLLLLLLVLLLLSSSLFPRSHDHDHSYHSYQYSYPYSYSYHSYHPSKDTRQFHRRLGTIEQVNCLVKGIVWSVPP